MATPDDKMVLNLPAELRGLWYLLLEKVWLVAGIVVLFSAGGVFYALRLPKLYQATTTVEVDSEDQRKVTMERGSANAVLNEEELKTIEQNLLSPALALRVVRRPELQQDPRFLPRVRRPASEERLRTTLSKEITASLRRGTHLIDVTVEDENPAMAQKLAQVLVEEYLAGSSEGRAAASQGAHEDLRGEADRLKARLTKSEQALQQYKEQNRAVSLEEKQNIVVERLKELNARVTTAKGERLKLETDLAQLEQLRDSRPEELLALTSIAANEEVGMLRRKISEKETEIAALSRRYKSEHPKYIQAASELLELKSALEQSIGKAASTLTASAEAARTTESKIEEALHAQEQIALELGKMAIPYQALDREVVSDRALYDALLARVKESEIGQGCRTIRCVSWGRLCCPRNHPSQQTLDSDSQRLCRFRHRRQPCAGLAPHGRLAEKPSIRRSGRLGFVRSEQFRRVRRRSWPMRGGCSSKGRTLPSPNPSGRCGRRCTSRPITGTIRRS